MVHARGFRLSIALAVLALFGAAAPGAHAATLLGYWSFNSSGSPLHDDLPPGGAHDLSVAAGTPTNVAAGAPGNGRGESSVRANSDSLGGTGIAVDTTAGAYNSVSFWMNWGGVDSGSGAMPFSWGTAQADLYFWGGGFGFNTYNGDITGISSTGLASSWVFVTAIWKNGTTNVAADNILYLNGVAQTISLVAGTGTIARTVGSSFYFSGSYTAGYAFGGSLDELRIYSGALSQSEVTDLYNSSSVAVPEPASFGAAALAAAAVGLGARRSRRAR